MPPAPPPHEEPLGVVLAGGLARRMGGGDKGALLVGGRPVLARVVAAMQPQLAGLALNANGDPARFAALGPPVAGLPVLADSEPGHPGPLAGLLAGLDWAAAQHAAWLVTVPGDCPFLPPDLVARLVAARGAATFVSAASAGRRHPVVGLWPVACRAALRAALRGGMRRVGAFADPAATVVVEWPVPQADPFFPGPFFPDPFFPDPFFPDPFFNVNTPADLAAAERLAAAMPPP